MKWGLERNTGLLVADVAVYLVVCLILVHVGGKITSQGLEDLVSTLEKNASVRVEHYVLTSAEELEFIYDKCSAGDTIHVDLIRPANDAAHYEFVLEPRYNTFFFVSTSLVCFVFVFLGHFVLRRRGNERSAWVFHNLCVVTALLICNSPTLHGTLSLYFSWITLPLYYLSYTVAPVLFVHFSFTFPADRSERLTWFLRIAYIVSVSLGVVLSLIAIQNFGSDHPHSVYTILFKLCRVFFVLYVAVSVARYVYSYQHARSGEERQKILWVMVGFIVSAAAFVTLWLIPHIVFGKGLISELAINSVTIVAPVLFSIGILRHRLMDIDLMVNRGAVYLTVGALLLGLYSMLVTLAVRFVGSDIVSLELIIPLIVIVNVLLFAPTRGLIQNFVDRKFFRVRYNFRIALRAAQQALGAARSVEELATLAVREIDSVIKARCVAFFSFEKNDNSSTLLASSGSMPPQCTPLDSQVFVRQFAITAPDTQVNGFIALGEKISGQGFTDEDEDVIRSLANQCAILMEGFSLQQQVLREKREAEQQRTISELKTYFVSAVSHDMKTPLTSIRLYGERIEETAGNEKLKNYARVIVGECDRLTRLIDNVLDYSLLEKGLRVYAPHTVDPCHTVQRVLEVMHYQFSIGGFSVVEDYGDTQSMIFVDEDAFEMALINILSNAVKYSGHGRKIEVKVHVDKGELLVSIKDFGVGIDAKRISQLTSPYERIDATQRNSKRGSGLGLALVQHFVQSSGGRLSIVSAVGEGTEVSMSFPPQETNL